MRRVKEERFLVSPKADFWLLGGASLVVWALLTVGQEFAVTRGFLTATQLETQFWVIALFSYPHFAASQWLCYSRGKAFWRKNWRELFAVPLLLLAALAWVYCQEKAIGTLGLRFFLTAFLLLSGWHFAMQAFGSSVISFQYDGIRLDDKQRSALKASVLTLAIYFFACRFRTEADREVYGVELLSLSLPDWAYFAMAALVVVSALRAGHLLVFAPSRQTRTFPRGRAIVPWVALFFWWLPSLRSPQFFLYGIPLFHGLQQYAFTYRFERARGKSLGAILLLAAGLVGFGYVLHRTVPFALDDSGLGPRSNFFFLCFTFAINIHHYFLDRANWRMSDPETRRLLLGNPLARSAASYSAAQTYAPQS